MLRRIISLILPIIIVIACMVPVLVVGVPEIGLAEQLTRIEAVANLPGTALLSGAGNSDNTAANMQIRKAEGDVSVSAKSGKPYKARENMLLYDGYGIGTQKKSYAWIDLDTARLIKLDEISSSSINKKGKNLEITLSSGKLFFNITEPLKDNESLNIRTSSLAIAIRGTCGWVEIISDSEAVIYLLEGTIEVTVTDLITGEVKTGTVTAGETVRCVVYDQDKPGDKCDIIRGTFTEDDIDGFVLVELIGDDTLIEKIYTDTIGEVNLRGITIRQAYERLTADQEKLKDIMYEPDSDRYNYPAAAYRYTPGDGHGGESGEDQTISGTYTPAPDIALGAPAQPGGTTSLWAGTQPYPFEQPTRLPWQIPTQAPVLTPTAAPMPSFPVAPTPQPTRTSAIPTPSASAAPTATPSASPAPTDTPGSVLPQQTPPSQEPSGADTTPPSQEPPSTDTTPPTQEPDLPAVSATFTPDTPGGNIGTTTFRINISKLKTGDKLHYYDVRVHIWFPYTFKEGDTLRDIAFGLNISDMAPDGTWSISGEPDLSGNLTLRSVPSPEEPPMGLMLAEIQARLDSGEDVTVPEPFTIDGALTVPAGRMLIFSQNIELTLAGNITVNGTMRAQKDVTNGGTITVNSGDSLYVDGMLDTLNGSLIVGSTGKAQIGALSGVPSLIPGAVILCRSNGATPSIQIDEYTLSGSYWLTSQGGYYIFAYCMYKIEGTELKVLSVGTNMYFPGDKDSIESITVDKGTTEIPTANFNGFANLTSVSLPDGLVSIGMDAFSGCGRLSSIDIPGSVTSIGDMAFRGCGSLTEVSVPEGVTSIGNNTFSQCSDLLRISLPSSLLSIGPGAFFGCESLTAVNIPSGVTSIGKNAFYGCSGIAEIAIPDGVEAISEGAFGNCKALARIAIPDSVISIGDRAFKGCESLASVSIPSSVTSIGAYAFSECALTDIAVPPNVTSIGEYAFYECSDLSAISIPSGVKSIGASAFNGCSRLTEVDLPDGITSISRWLFSRCDMLSKVSIPSGVTSIGASAFYDCRSLTDLAIPGDVTSIGSNAFYLCLSLTELAIPGGVTSIGSNAFTGCNALTNITYDGTATEWAEISKDATIPPGVTIACTDGTIRAGASSTRMIPSPIAELPANEYGIGCDTRTMEAATELTS